MEQNISLLKEYIKSVVKNIDNNIIKRPIDLVISGGAFNGMYGIGIIMFLRELVKLNKITINRVSGTSVGSILALFQFIDLEKHIENIYFKLKNCLQTKCNLYVYKDLLKEIVDNSFDDDVSFLNDKLFLTYTDINTYKQIVKSTYETKEDLYNALLKSSYIPLLMDDNDSVENQYIDGITPYIFKDNNQNDILYINLVPINNLYTFLSTANEENPHYRIIQGVSDISNFFLKGNANMCSFIKNWNIIDFTLFRLYNMIALLFFIGIIKLNRLHIPKNIQENKLYLLIKITFINLLKDFAYKISK